MKMPSVSSLLPASRTVRRVWSWPRWHLTYSVKRTINGQEMRIPLICGLGRQNLQSHEREVSALIAALLRSYPGTFLDVGVNLGQTLLKVVTLEPTREYIGFEPSAACCGYVERLIARNHLTNCSLLPLAMADRAAAIDLHFNKEADGAATIVGDFWVGRNAKRLRKMVWAEEGDTVIEALRLDSIGIIKIDVEGGELEVISGLKKTLAAHRPAILLEVLPFSCDIAKARENTPAIRNRRERMERLVQLLGEIAYHAFRYQPDGALVETTDFDAPRYDAAMCNYLLLHREHLGRVEEIRALYGGAV